MWIYTNNDQAWLPAVYLSNTWLHWQCLNQLRFRFQIPRVCHIYIHVYMFSSRLKGEALYIVQLFGKPSKKDFEKVCDVQASKKNSSDSESLYDADCEEGPHTPNIKVQTQFKSKPDLIMVEKKIKEGDERDTCIVEVSIIVSKSEWTCTCMYPQYECTWVRLWFTQRHAAASTTATY